MNDKDLIRALRRMAVEIGSLVCLGCGHEHNCNVHGCAIINEAAARLEKVADASLDGTYVSIDWLRQVEAERDSLKAKLDAVTTLSNAPLTLDEFVKMDGKPVWIETCAVGVSGWTIIWGLATVNELCLLSATDSIDLPYDKYGETWLAYRCKPEYTQA